MQRQIVAVESWVELSEQVLTSIIVVNYQRLISEVIICLYSSYCISLTVTSLRKPSKGTSKVVSYLILRPTDVNSLSQN